MSLNMTEQKYIVFMVMGVDSLPMRRHSWGYKSKCYAA